MFRLLRYFSITSLVVIAVAAIALGLFYRNLALQQLSEIGEQGNVTLARAFASTLWPQIGDFLDTARPLTADAIRAHPKTLALHKALLAEAHGLPVIGIRLYSLDGRVVYSSEFSQIGQDEHADAGVVAALGGRIVSQQARSKAVGPVDPIEAERDLQASYLPLRAPGDERVAAVMGIDSDVTSLLAGINRHTAQVIGAVASLLVLLYFLLRATVRYADRMVRRQWRQRELSREAQKNSETQLQLMTDSVSALIAYVDRDWRFRFCNNRYAEWFGQPPGWPIGLHVRDALGESAFDYIRPYFEQAFAGKTVGYERPVLLKNGVLADIDVTLAPRYGPDGAVEGVFALGHDITARKRMERELQEAKQRLDLALGASHISLWEWDARRGTIYVDAAWADIAGGDRREAFLPPEHLVRAIHPDDVEAVLAAQIACMKGRSPEYAKEHRVRATDGEWRWIDSRGKVVERDEHGRAMRMTGTNADITSRKQAEQALKESEARFRALTELSSDWFWEQDEEHRFTRFSQPSGDRILGFDAEAALGKARWELPGSLNLSDADWARHRAQLDAHKPFRDFIIKRVDDRGEILYHSISGLPFFGDKGMFKGYRGVGKDVTERVKAEERILQLAHLDPLTGLPNRVLIQDRISQALAHARRQGGTLATMFLDLDRFKNINDSLGHQVGDALLQDLATRLTQALREGDSVGRLGGDEFIISLPTVKNNRDIVLVAAKLLESLQRPFMVMGHELHVSASIGISVYPVDGADVQALMRNADTAMYHAKAGGRNAYQFFTPQMNANAYQRLSLENSLRGALGRDEFLLNYQPRVDLESGKILGFEALIRWQRPLYPLVQPLEFIGVSEDTGLIHAIGEWVLRKACSQARLWYDAGHKDLRMSVNISAKQLRQPDFVDMVQRVVAETGIPPTLLELEVTESVLMENPEATMVVLEKLRVWGPHLAIDDFGTGFSSLSYLKRFPFDVVKIDQSFVRDIEVDPADAALVSAIVTMAGGLGLDVTAEGVEKAEQATHLRALGCDSAQGFYYSPPLSAEDCVALMRSPPWRLLKLA